MKTKFSLLTVTFALIFGIYTPIIIAQNIGINATGTAPAASAGLDVDFTNKGLLVPRVALTALNAAGPIAAPATSLLVYNTATAGVAPNNVTPGYYYWGGAAWIKVSTGGDDWKIIGNAGTNAATNFLGTTDNNSLAFRTNNIERMRILNTGNVGIGTATPGFRLDLNTGTFAFGNGNVRTETRDNAGLQGNAGAQSGFFETVNPTNYPAGATSWWHLIDTRHSNNGNNYALQLSGSFFDQFLYYRKTNGSPTTAWSIVAATSNFGTSGDALISQGAGVAPVWGSGTAGQQFSTVYSTAQINLNPSNNTFFLIPGLTQTITVPTTGIYDMYMFTDGGGFVNSGSGNVGEQLEISIWVDGVPSRYITQIIDNPSNYVSGIRNWTTSSYISAIPAGVHTIEVYARNRGATYVLSIAATNVVANYMRSSLSVGLTKR